MEGSVELNDDQSKQNFFQRNSFVSKKNIILLLALALILGSVFVFYFIDFSRELQMALYLLLFSISYLTGFILYKKRQHYAHFIFSLSCVLLMFLVTQYISLWHIEDSMYRSLFLLLTCLIWLITGIVFNILYLQALALLSFIFILGWVTLPFFAHDFNWFYIEGLWFLAFLILFTVSYPLKKLSKKTSLNVFLHAHLLLIVPEIQSFYISAASLDMIQLMIFVKVIMISMLLFLNRNKIMELSKMEI